MAPWEVQEQGAEARDSAQFARISNCIDSADTVTTRSTPTLYLLLKHYSDLNIFWILAVASAAQGGEKSREEAQFSEPK